jgi:hypothetical protein
MKTALRTVAGIAAMALFIGVSFKLACNAQVMQAPTQAQPVQQQPDSIVAIVADSQGLPLTPYGQLPRYGTFWQIEEDFQYVCSLRNQQFDLSP